MMQGPLWASVAVSLSSMNRNLNSFFTGACVLKGGFEKEFSVSVIVELLQPFFGSKTRLGFSSVNKVPHLRHNRLSAAAETTANWECT